MKRSPPLTAIQFKPDYHPAWYNKAICYSEKNEIDLAIESWEQAINLNPQYRERAKTKPSFDKGDRVSSDLSPNQENSSYCYY